MLLGSHNSWSYLKPKRWWQRPFSFMARCQSKDIKYQYYLGVRCFDVRIKMKGYLLPEIVHNKVIYDISLDGFKEHLDFLNLHGDCWVRVVLDVRTKKDYTPKQINQFRNLCRELEEKYPNIKFWCGRNLWNWQEDYEFQYHPSCEEDYSSVCYPKYIDDWWPWLYARLNNRKILSKGTDKDILLIDFVNIK